MIDKRAADLALTRDRIGILDEGLRRVERTLTALIEAGALDPNGNGLDARNGLEAVNQALADADVKYQEKTEALKAEIYNEIHDHLTNVPPFDIFHDFAETLKTLGDEGEAKVMTAFAVSLEEAFHVAMVNSK